ncbi:hypothetical protein PoB_004454600 [Plakobranchus ocellatus]|uniref:Uncharacterized protein n=1 Tax=Plakobranchus ocellatus TaxID=259542 RepID=A0AAV4B3W5_9GAST|nr:hypothetical protein PoB_004454600 [Plakobranchus ocellatus]
MQGQGTLVTPASFSLLSNTVFYLYTEIAPPGQVSARPEYAGSGDLRLLGLPKGPGASDGARTRGRRVPGDLRAGSLSTVPPKPSHR